MATPIEHLTVHTLRRSAKLDATRYPRKHHVAPLPVQHDTAACAMCHEDVYEPVYWRRNPDRTISPLCTRCATS